MMHAHATEGHYQTRCTNGAHDVTADTSPPKGEGLGLRPHELLEAALAACLNITVRMEADRLGIPLAGVRTSVELVRTAERSTFTWHVGLEGDLRGEQRDALLAAAARCPVSQTLGRTIEVRPREGA
jgi:putative redox protein